MMKFRSGYAHSAFSSALKLIFKTRRHPLGSRAVCDAEKKREETGEASLRRKRTEARRKHRRQEGGHGARALIKLGAVITTAALVVNIASLVHSKSIDMDRAQAALNAPAAVEEIVFVPPELDSGKKDDAEKEETARPVAGVLTYAIGAVLSFFARSALQIFSPVIGNIISWLIFAAAVFAAVIIAMKKAFPGVPLKELLPKKSLAAIFAATAALIAGYELAVYYKPELIQSMRIAVLIAGAAFSLIAFLRLRDRALEIRSAQG